MSSNWSIVDRERGSGCESGIVRVLPLKLSTQASFDLRAEAGEGFAKVFDLVVGIAVGAGVFGGGGAQVAREHALGGGEEAARVQRRAQAQLLHQIGVIGGGLAFKSGAQDPPLENRPKIRALGF